jgi:chromosome segregation ATPase
MSEQASNGSGNTVWRRVWAITSIVLSVIALLLSVTAIAGTWIGRSATVSVSHGVLSGVDRLAQVGREGVSRLDGRLGEVRGVVTTVEDAVNQISKNVEDKGLIVTLLPEEKEQELEAGAQEVRQVFADIRGVIESVIELKQAIDKIPLVSTPSLSEERLQALQEDVNSLRSGVDELKGNVRQFREGAAGEINKVSAAASDVDSRLGEAQDDLAAIDGQLGELQARIVTLKQRLATLLTIVALVLTLLFGWIVYALVRLIQQSWMSLRA